MTTKLIARIVRYRRDGKKWIGDRFETRTWTGDRATLAEKLAFALTKGSKHDKTEWVIWVSPGSRAPLPSE